MQNEYRKRGIRKESLPETDRLLDPVLPQEISKEELIDRIFRKLEELGPEHRSVFVMHYREGFQIKEIAGMLDLPPGTVKSRLYYTRKYLAEQFQSIKDDIDF